MTVNIFENSHDKKPYTTSLEKVIEMIKTSPLLEDYTNTARSFLFSRQFDSYYLIKHTKFPAFAPAGILDGGKKKQNLIGLTGICFMKTKDTSLYQLKSNMMKLKNNPNVLLAYRTISGRGLHIFVPYTIEDNEPGEALMNTPGAILDTYQMVHDDISNYFTSQLGIETNIGHSKAHELCSVSFDAAAYVNYDAVPITIRFDYYDALPLK